MPAEQLFATPQPVVAPKAASGIKSILVHLAGDTDLDRRIDDALAIARAGSAHVTCLHVTPVEAYVAFDTFGGVFVMNDVLKALDERESQLRARIEERFAREDVSWDFQQVTGSVASSVLRFATLSDLIVTARETRNTEYAGPTIGFIGDLVKRSRVPVYLPAVEGPPLDPAGSALIAWDGGPEAANAVRASLGLLSVARDVRVLQIPVQPEEDPDSFPATRLLEYLSRHGIHAELDIEKAPSRDVDAETVAAMIAAQAEAGGASYLVMGAFGHSRFGEYLFGGVTRYLFASCPVPILTAH